MDKNDNWGGPDDHNYGPRRVSDPRSHFPTDQERANQEYDEQPLRLTMELKRRRQEFQPIRLETQPRSRANEPGKKARIYSVGIEDWCTALRVCNENLPDYEPRSSTFFANPQTRYPAPCATYPNPESINNVIGQNEPIPSTSAGPSYMRAGPSRLPPTEEEMMPPPSTYNPYPGTKASMFKTRWLCRRLEETLPRSTVFEPIPSTSRQSISPGPQPNTANVSTQVPFGELGNKTYEDQMEEQIESLKCILCQATNYCRKKCSMRGKRAHGMWCVHGIQLGNNPRSPEPDSTNTLNLTVGENRIYPSDLFANEVYVHTSQDFSVPSTSSQVTQTPGTPHDQVQYDDRTE